MAIEKPFAVQMIKGIRNRALEKNDIRKAGAMYPSKESVAPGKTYVHHGLKYLDLKR